MAPRTSKTPNEVIARYKPDRRARPDTGDMWPDIRDTVVDLVVGSRPSTDEHAKARMTSVTQFVTWLTDTGTWHPASGEPVPFSLPMVDHYANVLEQAGFKCVSTVRSRLKSVGRSYAPDLWPYQGTAKGRSERVPPYSPAEQRALWAVGLRLWDNGDPSVAAVIAAGLGAGLDTPDFRYARGTDLAIEPAGPVLHLTTPGRERTVPLADVWADRVTDTCTAIGLDLLVRQADPTTKNMMARISYKVERSGPFRLNPQRLRTAWLVDRLSAQVPPAVLMRHAGLTSIIAIGRVLEFVPDVTPDEADRLMRRSVT